MMPSDALRVWTLLTVAALLAGCGSNGPTRYQVTGSVSYAGEPVPSGEVIFEPDPARGNRGPQGRAAINRGKYASVPGQGAVAGPTIARVLAYDGKSHPESPYGIPLRPPHELRLELPAKDSTQDLTIPPPPR